MPDLSTRSPLPELMDELDIPREDMRNALREIETINRLLGGYDIVLSGLDDLNISQPITILDIGCGGGDMLRKISDWSKQKNKQVKLIGIDLNADAIDFAKEHSANYNIEYRTQNVFDEALLHEKVDIATNSLFCHHFKKDELVTILQRMYAIAGKAVIINDLHRHWFAYHAISVLTGVFAKSRLVRYDARLSVARAFTRTDWQEVLAAAGITNYSLKWRWAWRWQLVIKKQ